MERSWRLQFIPRYGENRSVLSTIIQTLTPTRYYKMYWRAKKKCKAIQKRKTFSLKDVILWISLLIFQICLPVVSQVVVFHRHPSFTQFSSALALQSPSHFHSSLTPPLPLPSSPPPHSPIALASPPLHLRSPLLANAATLRHNWSMPKLRQA